MNDSSTGGPLAPIGGGPAPLEGLALNNFLQGWIVGITGLAGAMVRPRWQPEPANIPTEGTAWAAIGVQVRPADTFPVVLHNASANSGNGQDEVHQHENLEILVSFYDLGTNGQADSYAAILRQGVAVDQNLELLTDNGMGLIACGEPIPLPSLLKQRWLYRVDLAIQVKREIIRAYPVLNLVTATATLEAENAGGNLIIDTLAIHQ